MSLASLTDHLLSLEEWGALPEDNSRHFELADGVLQVCPRAIPRHQLVVTNLLLQLNEQLPESLRALPDVEVTLVAAFPPTVRAPDVLVVPTTVLWRDLARLEPADVLLAVEITSPGSVRTDRITKFAEYADAGILSYWRVELDPCPRLTMHQLVDGAYQTAAQGADEITVTSPAPLTIDVAALDS